MQKIGILSAAVLLPLIGACIGETHTSIGLKKKNGTQFVENQSGDSDGIPDGVNEPGNGETGNPGADPGAISFASGFEIEVLSESLLPGLCISFEVKLIDSNGNPSFAEIPVFGSLSASNPITGQNLLASNVFSDSGCTQTSQGDLIFSEGQSTSDFYIRVPTSSSVVLVATSPVLESASHQISIGLSPGAPVVSMLVPDFSEQQQPMMEVLNGECVGPFSLKLSDELGNPIAAAFQKSFEMEGDGSFYPSALCHFEMSSTIQILANESTSYNFYFRPNGETNLTTNANGANSLQIVPHTIAANIVIKGPSSALETSPGSFIQTANVAECVGPFWVETYYSSGVPWKKPGGYILLHTPDEIRYLSNNCDPTAQTHSPALTFQSGSNATNKFSLKSTQAAVHDFIFPLASNSMSIVRNPGPVKKIGVDAPNEIYKDTCAPVSFVFMDAYGNASNTTHKIEVGAVPGFTFNLYKNAGCSQFADTSGGKYVFGGGPATSSHTAYLMKGHHSKVVMTYESDPNNLLGGAKTIQVLGGPPTDFRFVFNSFDLETEITHNPHQCRHVIVQLLDSDGELTGNHSGESFSVTNNSIGMFYADGSCGTGIGFTASVDLNDGQTSKTLGFKPLFVPVLGHETFELEIVSHSGIDAENDLLTYHSSIVSVQAAFEWHTEYVDCVGYGDTGIYGRIFSDLIDDYLTTNYVYLWSGDNYVAAWDSDDNYWPDNWEQDWLNMKDVIEWFVDGEMSFSFPMGAYAVHDFTHSPFEVAMDYVPFLKQHVLNEHSEYSAVDHYSFHGVLQDTPSSYSTNHSGCNSQPGINVSQFDFENVAFSASFHLRK